MLLSSNLYNNQETEAALLHVILKRQLSDTLTPGQFHRFWTAVEGISSSLDQAGDVAGVALEYVRIYRQDRADCYTKVSTDSQPLDSKKQAK